MPRKAAPTARVEAPEAEASEGRRRGRPRQGKAVARHLPRDEEILKIAAEVFFARGFEGAKLDVIAKEAGIVKGSLYHYFESKEDIYERLIEDIVNLVDFKDVAKSTTPPLDRLEAMIRRRLEIVAANPAEIGILARQLAHMEGETGDWARDYRRRNLDALREVIVQGQRAGVFRSADPEALAAFVLGAIVMLAECYRPGGRLDADTIVDELTHFILSGVSAKARRR